MQETNREFEVEVSEGKVRKLNVRRPTNQELQDGEFEYSRAFNNAIVSGILPQSKLMAELQKNGVWGNSDEEEIEEQRQLVIRLENALDDAKEEEAKVRIAEELTEERQKLFQLRQTRDGIFSHSAEAKAEESQRNFLVSRTVENADTKTRVWKSYDDYKKEEDGNILFRATYEYLTFMNGLPSDFSKDLPENKVVKTEVSEEPSAEAEVKTEAEVKEEAPAAPAETSVAE